MIERFLVFHGAFFAFAVATFATGTGALVSLLLRRRRVAALFARRARLVGAAARFDGGAEPRTITLEGRLEASGTLTERFEDGAPAAAVTALGADPFSAGARAGSLAVVTDEGERFAIEGTVEVVLGSRIVGARKAWESEPEEVQERLAKAQGILAPSEAPVYHSLAAGDRVLVRGAVQRENAAARAIGSYRVSAAPLALGAPDGGATDANVVRMAFASLPKGLSSTRALLEGALFGALAYAAVFVALPELLARATGEGKFLAASPLRHGRSFDTLVAPYEDALERRFDQALFESLVALREREGRCGEAAGMLYERRQFERAAHAALRCGRPAVAVLAEYRMGRFEGAFDLGSRSAQGGSSRDDEAQALRLALLSGRLASAAQIARAAANRPERAAQAKDFQCVADALDARGGDRAARDRLGKATTPACRTLFVDVAAPAERKALSTRSCARLVSASDLPGELEDLLTAPDCTTDRAPPGVSPELTLFAPSWAARDAAVAAEAVARIDASPEKTVERRRLLFRLASLLATFEFSAGELDRARVWAERAALEAGLYEAAGSSARGEALVAEAAVLAAVLGADGAETVRGLPGAKGSWLSAVELPNDERKTKLVKAGSGGALADLLFRAPETTEALLRAIALTNRDESGRLALAHWLRWGKDVPSPALSTFGVFADAAARLRLAEALGDEPLAEELREAVRAFRGAFLRRETAVALALADELLDASP